MSKINIKFFIVCAVICIVIKETICESDIFPYIFKRQGAFKYCGKHLANTLQLICNGLYNTMFKKNGGQGPDMEDYLYHDGSPFRPQQYANDLMSRLAIGRFRRESRGVHDECCLKSCTINEMLSYCAQPR